MGFFRVASAKDYTFNRESGFWELSFDRRPVAGTRCEDPEQGAVHYNQARAKFKAKLKEGTRPEHVYLFSELVKWVIASGDLAQRTIVLAMLQAQCTDEYSEIARRALSIIPSHFDFCYFFTDHNAQRLRVSAELRQQLKAAIEGAD